MKTKMTKFFLTAACLAAMAPVFTACDDDNDDPFNPAPLEIPFKAYILAEGSMGQNNSVLTAVRADSSLEIDLYQQMNERGLGDTGQDLLFTNGYLFATVSGSGYISKMDEFCDELSRLTLDPATLGSPRYMVAQDNYLYVTLYGNGSVGYVAKVAYQDSLCLVDTVQVGAYPEQLALVGGKIVTCNSGYSYGHTLSVIDPETMTVEQTLSVDTNPTRIVTGTNGKAYYLTTAYDANWVATVTLHELNPADWSSRTVQQFSGASVLMAQASKALYLAVSSTTDYVHYATTFSSVDYETGQFSSASFLNDADLTAELGAQNIYMLAVDSYTKEIYIATSNYTTNSSLYIVSSTGKLTQKYADAGGVNVSAAAFVPNFSEVTIY
jgi:hypothetical protein